MCGVSLGDERCSDSCLILGGILTSGGTVIRNEWLGSLPVFYPLGQPLGFSLAEKAPQNVLLEKCENPLRWIRRLGHVLSLRGGEVAEWFKAHAWKACVANPYRGFKSLPLRQISF